MELFDQPSVTYGQVGDAVAAVRTPAEARRFFVAYVRWLHRYGVLDSTPFDVARQNIGYLFGYGGFSQDQIAMWKIVTGAYHPLGFV